MRKVIRVACALLAAQIASAAALADASASILLYHRFGEDDIPSTNVRLAQFEAHIAELKDGGYSFLALSEVVRRFKAHEPLPERTVVVTVDDAYKSVMLEGWPRLKAAGIPLTLFVSTDITDQPSANYMSWDDIRALMAEGVEIGHHGAAHMHMPHAGLEAALKDIRRASERFKAELGYVPKLFAYPYGEYSLALRNAVEAEGFDAALAQVSGAVSAEADQFALSRFPINEHYAGLDRFRLIAGAVALPVYDIAPQDPVLSADHNPPLFGFTVDGAVRGLPALTCYPSHTGKPAELIRLEGNRIEVRFDQPFPKGRNRINCTMPAGKGRWYWFGKFFYVPGGKLD